MDQVTVSSPIKREVGGVFVPVADVHRARTWYRDVLGLAVGEVIAGHLCCISMDNSLDLLLDQKLTPDNAGLNVEKGTYPLFMFMTDDIHASLAFLQARGVNVVKYDDTFVQNGHWFNFHDCDGNLLMVCDPR